MSVQDKTVYQGTQIEFYQTTQIWMKVLDVRILSKVFNLIASVLLT